MKPEPMQHANALPTSQSPLLKWVDQHGNAATVVACVAMIGGAIWYSMSKTSAGNNATAWAKYSEARTAKSFGDIADDYASTDVGPWARLGEGERYLDSGIQLMFTDRKAGLRDLKKADEAFQKVLAVKSAASAARERAAWGLAKSTETQCDGDTKTAIAGYQALLNQFPNSLYKAAAEERIEALKADDAKEFYAWFHKQNPTPPEPKKPKDGLPSGHPSLDSLMNDDDKDKPETEKTDGSEKKTETKEEGKPEVKPPELKEPTEDKPKSEPKPEGAAAKSVLDRLSVPIEASFNRTPLQEAVRFVAESCQVEIGLDGDALKAAGFTKNMPQTMTLENLTGLEVIGVLLKRYEKEKVPMVLVIDKVENKAIITTTEFAEKAGLKPFDFSKPAESPKPDAPKSDKPKTEEPKSESKDKDAPADSQ